MSLRFAAPDGVKVGCTVSAWRPLRCTPEPAIEREMLPSTPQVYTVAGGKNLPTWVSDKKKRSLRKDEDYNRR